MWIKYLKEFKFFLILVIFFVTSLTLNASLAQNSTEEIDVNEYYHINLDKDTIAKGYTVTAFEDQLKLSLVPGILDESTRVEIIELNEYLPMPWQLDKISPVFQFEFKNKKAYKDQNPFYIQFAYQGNDTNLKQVFFFDKNYSTWRPLPTKDFSGENFVRSLIHLPYARIAVFSYPTIMSKGRSSWYKYKNGNFAASPDFPKGSRIRVHNLENKNFVDVVINDYGPDRNIFPDRVIDLDKVAFDRIASLYDGVINIAVEPLSVEPDSFGNTLGIGEHGASTGLVADIKAGIVIDEDTENVLWEKNSTTSLPLASLTKIVAIKIFLDTKPSLNREVAYSTNDEEYNYEYCERWESAKISLNDGDVLTIEDLVYSSLVASANNTIETLVRVSGLARDDFIHKMNTTVQEWGATSTYFEEPTGLSPENVSSPADYAIISKRVLANPIIQKASTMAEYQYYTINTEEYHKVRNTNNIIKTSKYIITGSKTGYLDEAGYCLMTRVKVNEHSNIIVVTFGANSRDKSFYETEKLIQYGIRKINRKI